MHISTYAIGEFKLCDVLALTYHVKDRVCLKFDLAMEDTIIITNININVQLPNLLVVFLFSKGEKDDEEKKTEVYFIIEIIIKRKKGVTGCWKEWLEMIKSVEEGRSHGCTHDLQTNQTKEKGGGFG